MFKAILRTFSLSVCLTGLVNAAEVGSWNLVHIQIDTSSLISGADLFSLVDHLLGVSFEHKMLLSNNQDGIEYTAEIANDDHPLSVAVIDNLNSEHAILELYYPSSDFTLVIFVDQSTI